MSLSDVGNKIQLSAKDFVNQSFYSAQQDFTYTAFERPAALVTAHSRDYDGAIYPQGCELRQNLRATEILGWQDTSGFQFIRMQHFFFLTVLTHIFNFCSRRV